LNIGNDNSGTHCGTSKLFSGDVSIHPVNVGGIHVLESQDARTAFTKFFEANKDLLPLQVMRKVKNLGKKWLQCSVKILNNR
jgi:hypothetical protein